MFVAAKGAAKGEWKNSREVVEQFLELNKAQFQLIGEMYIAGEIDKNDLKYRLDEMKVNVKMQSEALKVVAKVAAENAANAALDVLENALKLAVGL